ncbi:hypothetical protein GW17_00053679 [Ensete ventricosum]|nr:hypothetical protein GW17_00053679 [Ensete ventricosum]
MGGSHQPVTNISVFQLENVPITFMVVVRGESGAYLLDDFRLRVLVGGADLTCVRSAVRPLAPPVYSAGYLRRVSHVGGPAVRGCDDLAARLAFVISFFPPPREDLLEAPDEGVEDEVLCLTAGSRSP